jgi:hypothetical protein
MPPSSAAAATALQNFQSSEVSPDTAIAQGNNKYGVSGLGSQLDALRSTTSNLQKSIANVDPSVTGRTSGSLVTEAQRAAIVNNEQQPLVKNFNDVSTNLNDVDKQYGEATGLASNYANAVLGNQSQEYGQLFGQYNTALQKEEADSAAAEKQREFDASLADAKSARAASASSGLDLSSLLGGASTPKPQAISADPHQAVSQLFQGYNPQQDKYYTENTVIPKLTQLVLATGPYTPAYAMTLAKQIAYNYRKQTYGE